MNAFNYRENKRKVIKVKEKIVAKKERKKERKKQNYGIGAGRFFFQKKNHQKGLFKPSMVDIKNYSNILDLKFGEKPITAVKVSFMNCSNSSKFFLVVTIQS